MEEKNQREEEDAKLARELQEQLNGLGGDGANSNGGFAAPAVEAEPATPTSTPASGVVSNGAPKAKANAMEDNMKKLSAMNSDFFSGM